MPRVARAILGIVWIVTLVACRQSAPDPPPASAPQPVTQDPVARGKYLVEAIAGCDDCHTPKKITPDGPEPDMTRRLSGHPETAKLGVPPKPTGGWIAAGNDQFTAWAGPWGISYAANLTPDEDTGIGIWTEDIFVRAIRERRHMGQSRPILPPMPVHVFRKMTDDDLKAIWAFLRTLPPIVNRVPDPVINEAPAPWTSGRMKTGT